MTTPPCDWCRLIGATHVEADHPLPKDHPDYDALYDADPDELVSALLTDAEDVTR